MRRIVFLLLGLCLLAVSCGDAATPSDGTVTVPDVAGQTVDYARGALAAVGLTPDIIEVEQTGTPAGMVIEQVPAAAIRVAAGLPVVIKVAAGSPTTSGGHDLTTTTGATTTVATTTTHATTTTATAPPVLMPDVVCWNLQDAQDEIQRAGVWLSLSRDATGAGRRQLIDSNWLVVDQEPPPGTPIGEGDPLLLVVKYGEPNPCGA